MMENIYVSLAPSLRRSQNRRQTFTPHSVETATFLTHRRIMVPVVSVPKHTESVFGETSGGGNDMVIRANGDAPLPSGLA